MEQPYELDAFCSGRAFTPRSYGRIHNALCPLRKDTCLFRAIGYMAPIAWAAATKSWPQTNSIETWDTAICNAENAPR